jgi:hypothetical protein
MEGSLTCLRWPRAQHGAHLATVQRLALVPVELLLEVRLGVGRSCEKGQWDFELLATECAYSYGGSGTQPLNSLRLRFAISALVLHRTREVASPVKIKRHQYRRV